MKQRMLAAAVVLISTVVARADLAACGDKFLMPSRGLTFRQAYKPAHLASVLIYAPATAPSEAALMNAKLRAMLTLVGHRVTVASDAVQLAQLLASTKADVVLTDLAEAASITRQISASQTHAIILPVLFKPTRAESDACKAQYLCQLKNTDKPEHFLATIDLAMKRRLKAAL